MERKRENKEIESPLVSAPTSLTANTDRITICIYSREAQTVEEFHHQMQDEQAQVDRIRQGFTEAALSAGQNPPEFVISVQLIPDWQRPDNSYSDSEYLAKKMQFMDAVYTNFPRDFFSIHDFYSDEPPLSEDEIRYLEHLDSGGCCLDMLKVKAIISNMDRQHLQLDSNTLLHNYPELYNTTFGRVEARSMASDASDSIVLGISSDEPLDGLNAALYGNDHVSAHSKIVYTVPGGSIGPALAHYYGQYCKATHDPEDKEQKSNQFYSSVFSKAMRATELTTSLKHPTRERYGKKANYSPADMERKEYRITRYVVPAIKQTWKTPLSSSAASKSSLYSRSVLIRGIPCDMSVFEYIVRKHTSEIVPDGARIGLLQLSDVELDFHIAGEFYKYISDNHPEEISQLDDRIPPTSAGMGFKQYIQSRPPYRLSHSDFESADAKQISSMQLSHSKK